MAAGRARITTPNFVSSGDGFRIYAEKVDQWKDVCVLTKDKHTVRPIGGSGIQFCFLLIVSSFCHKNGCVWLCYHSKLNI